MHARIDPTPPRRRVVIDCDPGIDDVVALALATRSPELDVVAVVTTYGNTTLAHTTRNARVLLELAGKPDIPVLAGSDRPLQRHLVTAPETHGPTGVGHAQVPDAEPCTANPTALLDVLAGERQPVSLVTLGPLTNLAHAYLTDAALVRARVDHHLGMFGNLHERGNTNRWADFNAWCDPEATVLALQNTRVSMVGLDVTRRITLSRTEVDRLAAASDPLTGWLGAALRFYVEFHRAQERLDGCVVNDVLPLGELIRPGMIDFERHSLVVDLDGGEHRGHTRVGRDGWETSVARSVDVPAMRALLGRVFAHTWQDQE